MLGQALPAGNSRRAKKRGDREEEIQNSHSTPWIVHTDSSFICNSFRVGNVGCWWNETFSLFFRFTTGIRNLRIHPDEKMGFERLANRNCMECPTPARAFRSTNPLFQGHLYEREGRFDLESLGLTRSSTPVNDAMGEKFFFVIFHQCGPVEIGGEWQSLVDLPLNESRSSQRSGLGSGIPSLVGAFGSKVIKCGAGSSLSTSSASREGDRGDPDFRSLLYGGRSLSYQECFGEAREDGLDREAMLIPLLYR
ncbi:hypothetical protein Tco_1092197 [Tanacetum coccineum]|uniref:Uncharacterized protein n=1 Tax=Tanacetum coccineum TaxID=301880 RepID=A0ABQ5IAE8_9ASTR